MDDYKLGQKDLSLADNPDVMSNEELLNEIDRMSKMSIDKVDVTRIEYYLEILQNRDPVMEDVDMQELWDNMVEKQPDLFAFNGGNCERVTKKARKYVPIRFIWAAIMILTLLMVTASAFDKNPFETIISWTKETLIMHSNPSGEMELPEGEAHEYRSLEDAFLIHGATNLDYPTWIPEEYAISDIAVWESEFTTIYEALYTSGSNSLFFSISVNHDKSSVVSAVEKDGIVDTYTNNGHEYFIVTDLEYVTAIWEKDGNQYIISGIISDEEMKSILDSIK